MASATLYLTFSAYLTSMALIGWAAWRRPQGISDYLLGGRRLVTIALSLVTRPPPKACLATFDQACGRVRNAGNDR